MNIEGKKHKIDTFSANSLKILDKNREEFILKYEKNLVLNKGNKSAKAGQNLHTYLCYYLKNFDISKIEKSFSESDRNFIEKIKGYDAVCALKHAKNKQIEAPFFVKCDKYYLTGRFDAVLIDKPTDKTVHIFDWKTVNLPKNAENDIQTTVYLFAASKLFETQNLDITYVSLVKNESEKIAFNSNKAYEKIILDIIKKL